MKTKANILLGVTGGIAAYKACDLINMLRKQDYDVRVIMTEHAKQFITPMTLSTLSRHPVMDDMWSERKGDVEHIDIGKWADGLVLYPATFNIIGKFSSGICDDLLSTVFQAIPCDKKRIIFPSMNNIMWENKILQKNISLLKEVYGSEIRIVEPIDGRLACGDVGKGKLVSPPKAVKEIVDFL